MRINPPLLNRGQEPGSYVGPYVHFKINGRTIWTAGGLTIVMIRLYVNLLVLYRSRISTGHDMS